MNLGVRDREGIAKTIDRNKIARGIEFSEK